jgi:hypothetical protein
MTQPDETPKSADHEGSASGPGSASVKPWPWMPTLQRVIKLLETIDKLLGGFIGYLKSHADRHSS